MDTPEEFRDIPGYEGYYQVSNHGRVKALARTVESINGQTQTLCEHLMKMTPHINDGYPQLALTRDGHSKTYRVSRLVLLAFLGNPPPGYQACHEDGNPGNNRLDNLRWDTPKSNYADRERHSIFPDPTKPHNAKLSEEAVLAIRIDPRSHAIVAREYGVTSEAIGMVRQYKT